MTNKKEFALNHEQRIAASLAGVFPPNWKRADRWRVKMDTEKPAAPIYGRPPPYEDVVFDVTVADVPSASSAFYRLVATGTGARAYLRYDAYYHAAPFSFARIVTVDESGKPDQVPLPPVEPSRPHLSNRLPRFIDDFPTTPQPTDVAILTYPMDFGSLEQVIEPTDAGVRFTITHGGEVVVIEWRRGDPWWSTLERKALALPGTSLSDRYLGRGELIR